MHKLKKIAVMASMMSVLAAFAEPKPYTHSNYLEDSSEFRFAIIPDRFGADYRAKDYHTDFRGGFTNAIRVVNLLRPNFVMSIGDLIPYGWLDEASIRQQHRELKADLDKIVPPFYYVVGNHDICRNEDSTKVWTENWGKDTYYSFVYRNCLFVALNSCDLKVNEMCGILLRMLNTHGLNRRLRNTRMSAGPSSSCIIPPHGYRKSGWILNLRI